MMSVEERSELLAAAEPADLVALAERCLDRYGEPQLLIAPETGLVMLQVREPVQRERFHLGEVVVTRAEVHLAGHRGWSMRLGRDRLAALAGAVCDAAANAGGPLAAEVDALCERTRDALATLEAETWADLVATTVAFEELD
jgi:alpha-D-ribose 1-methylphosphonate 5-triphosphate synthase subunit PhnG